MGLAETRKAAGELLLETGSSAPEWRQAFIELPGGDEPDAIAPICTDEYHDPEDPTVYTCCPEPVIEVADPTIGAYLAALLNTDRRASGGGQ